MKKVLIFVLTALLMLTSCAASYNEPDTAYLCDTVLTGQNLTNMTSASDADISVIFGVDLALAESYAVKYSGNGGYADIVAVFCLNDDADTSLYEEALLDYKAARYNDFKGYAPLEAEKVEQGKVLTYGRYVLLLIVPDISAAAETVETEFTK